MIAILAIYLRTVTISNTEFSSEIWLKFRKWTPCTSDWSVNSFIIVVCEKNVFNRVLYRKFWLNFLNNHHITISEPVISDCSSCRQMLITYQQSLDSTNYMSVETSRSLFEGITVWITINTYYKKNTKGNIQGWIRDPSICNKRSMKWASNVTQSR